MIDVVAVSRMDSGEQVFATARPLSAQVYEVASLMEHPLEDGSSVTDHIVYQPIEIDLPLMVTEDVETVLAEIRALYRSAELLTVQTVSGAFSSMVIQAMPHDEKAESFGSATINLQLKEAVFVKAVLEGAIAPAQVARPATTPNRRPAARASTAARGAQQTTTPTAPTEQRGSTLYRLFGGK